MTVEGPNKGEFRWTVVADDCGDELDFAGALASTVAGLGPDADHDAVKLWVRDVDDRSDTAAVQAGFVRYRDLWQLRCPLPNAASNLTTRAFTEADLDEFVAVNNRAFHWHPEQGGLTAEAMRISMSEPWFDPDGFRLHHDSDNILVGFCWTKVHTDQHPPLGEIYVIAVDPSQHGRGLGKPMTLAGLEWLSTKGLEHAMLYVESDNDAANATYTALGFTHHHTDRAYRLDR